LRIRQRDRAGHRLAGAEGTKLAITALAMSPSLGELLRMPAKDAGRGAALGVDFRMHLLASENGKRDLAAL